MRTFILAIVSAHVVCSPASGENWPRFRGPNGSGVSPSRNVPVEFDSTKNVKWKTEPGAGTSSPVVFGERCYVTAQDGAERIIRCFDLSSGRSLWTQSVQSTRTETSTPPCGPATPTPAVNEAGVFAFFSDFGIVACSHRGRLLWKTETPPFDAFHGVAASLVVADGHVLLQADQLQGSYVAAYRVETGEQAWRQERFDGATAGYSTPSVFRRTDGGSEFVVTGPIEVAGYDARTGRKNWWMAGVGSCPISVPLVVADRLFLCEPYYSTNPFQPDQMLSFDGDKDGQVTVEELKANPVIHRLGAAIDAKGNGDGVVSEQELVAEFSSFIGSGGLKSFQLGAQGAISKDAVDWSYEKTVPQIASAIVYPDVLYIINDGGVLLAFHPETGELVKRARLGKGGRKFEASPVAADGKLFLADLDGTIHVVEALPLEQLAVEGKWNLLATNELQEPIHASPAIADGKILVRTETTLYCFGS